MAVGLAGSARVFLSLGLVVIGLGSVLVVCDLGRPEMDGVWV